MSVSVFEGNTSDPKTLLSAVGRVREKFGIAWFTIVGDRGMITQVQIDVLREIEGLDWITALRSDGRSSPLFAMAMPSSVCVELNMRRMSCCPAFLAVWLVSRRMLIVYCAQFSNLHFSRRFLCRKTCSFFE